MMIGWVKLIGLYILFIVDNKFCLVYVFFIVLILKVNLFILVFYNNFKLCCIGRVFDLKLRFFKFFVRFFGVNEFNIFLLLE